jgi:hypothetical protein
MTNKIGGTLTCQKWLSEAPLSKKASINIQLFYYLEAPLAPNHGTPVGNHLCRAQISKCYCKLDETFHFPSECKSDVDFERCLMQVLAQWSTVFLTVRMSRHHLGTVGKIKTYIFYRDRTRPYYSYIFIYTIILEQNYHKWFGN